MDAPRVTQDGARGNVRAKPVDSGGQRLDHLQPGQLGQHGHRRGVREEWRNVELNLARAAGALPPPGTTTSTLAPSSPASAAASCSVGTQIRATASSLIPCRPFRDTTVPRRAGQLRRGNTGSAGGSRPADSSQAARIRAARPGRNGSSSRPSSAQVPTSSAANRRALARARRRRRARPGPGARARPARCSGWPRPRPPRSPRWRRGSRTPPAPQRPAPAACCRASAARATPGATPGGAPGAAAAARTWPCR